MPTSIQTPLSDLRHIRGLMERSRYFIGLSGLSGVGAGISALLGVAAVVAYQWAGGNDLEFIAEDIRLRSTHPWGIAPVPFLVAVATLVVAGALGSAYVFTRRRVDRLGYALFDEKSFKLVSNLALPLVVGGVFCLALVYHAVGGLIGPTTLIFYGLALINGSSYVSEEVRLLGMLEIGLGLVALFFLGYGLYFWALGFGIFHIGYGLWMYREYEAHE